MKLRRLILLTVIALAAIVALPNAQAVQRLVLVEGFTQWNCGPCGSWNPLERAVLAGMTEDTVLAIKYHVWWPAPNNDAFYLYNVSEQQSRVSFYSVDAVPTTKVDGLLTSAQNQQTLRNLIRSRYAIAAPCTIDLTAYAESDGAATVNFVGTITAESDMLAAGTALRVVLITDRIQYASPPGSNGEILFDNIFRDFWPNAAGQAVSLAAGATYDFSGSLVKSASWHTNGLSVIAFVQITSTRQILQAVMVDIFLPPAPVDDLVIKRIGETNDIQLSWTAVANANEYLVYRCASTDVPLVPENLIATVTDRTCVDANAVDSGPMNYYVVVARLAVD